MADFLTLSKKLISIQSDKEHAGELTKVLELVKQELPEYNIKEFSSGNSPSLLIYNTKELPTKFKIILNGHLDVVPGNSDQFKPFEKDGKLYGRGSYDMKAATAVMIVLFKKLAKDLNFPIGLQLVTDEETGGFDGTKYQISQGINADFVIAGENTDLLINNRAKGIIWLRLTTKGKTAHGAYPWLGENAIVKMTKILKEIEQIYPIPENEAWQTTVNIATIKSPNETFNKIPDECTVGLDIRYIPEDKNNVVENIKKLLDKDTTLEIIVEEPCHITQSGNEYIKVLSKSIKTLTPQDAKLVDKHGSSDIRHYNAINADGITFGPVGFGHHSDLEWVDIKSLSTYSGILEDFLKSLN